MSSILTNNSAMTALSTLRNINSDITNTQSRISTGLKVSSGKDNAAYFAISETMKSDSGMYKSIDEGLTLTQNSVSTARLGAETIVELANSFVERVAFAQGDSVDAASVQGELDSFVAQMQTVIDQSSFNGESMVDSTSAITVVTGITRTGGTFATTTMTVTEQDLGAIQAVFAGIDLTTSTDKAADLATVEAGLADAVTAATSLGIDEKAVEVQKEFLKNLSDRLDTGISGMIDADMESEAAKLQALQVQQQLATQSLSIANQAPQNILALFR